jgi:hypothetical protein
MLLWPQGCHKAVVLPEGTLWSNPHSELAVIRIPWPPPAQRPSLVLAPRTRGMNMQADGVRFPRRAASSNVGERPLHRDAVAQPASPWRGCAGGYLRVPFAAGPYDRATVVRFRRISRTCVSRGSGMLRLERQLCLQRPGSLSDAGEQTAASR